MRHDRDGSQDFFHDSDEHISSSARVGKGRNELGIASYPPQAGLADHVLAASICSTGIQIDGGKFTTYFDLINLRNECVANGYVERGALVVRVLTSACSPSRVLPKKVKRRQAQGQLKGTYSTVSETTFSSNLQPLTNAHPQHFLPITCFFLIILPLLHLIDHVQIPLKTSVHSHYIHYRKCSALSLAFMHHLAYREQKCLSLRSMSHCPSLLLLVSSGQRLLSCLHSSRSPLRQHYLGP